MRTHFQAELLLNRHGVLTKGAVAGEGIPGGFAMLYKVLSAFEDVGRCQRGYFVESLGGAQFAVASTVDRLRSYLDSVEPERREYQTVVLAAADPANPYGAGRTLLSFTADPEAHHAAAGALADLVGTGRVQSLLVEKINGEPVLAPDANGDQATVVAALTAAGFARTPRGEHALERVL